MKVTLSPMAVLTLIGVGLAGFVGWRIVNAGGAAADAVGRVLTEDLNPASRENLVYSGVNAVGGWVTGSDDWSLGASLYDWTHTSTEQPELNTALQAINPADRENLIYRGVGGVGSAITGDKDWSLGGAIYDLLNN